MYFIVVIVKKSKQTKILITETVDITTGNKKLSGEDIIRKHQTSSFCPIVRGPSDHRRTTDITLPD